MTVYHVVCVGATLLRDVGVQDEAELMCVLQRRVMEQLLGQSCGGMSAADGVEVDVAINVGHPAGKNADAFCAARGSACGGDAGDLEGGTLFPSVSDVGLRNDGAHEHFDDFFELTRPRLACHRDA